jgi:hypothetical protein
MGAGFNRQTRLDVLDAIDAALLSAMKKRDVLLYR